MHLLCLLSGRDLAGANGPDGLVGNDDLAPVANLRLEGLELLADNLDGLVGFSLLEALAAAPDDTEAVFGGVLCLGGDVVVGFLEDGSALGVAEDGPGYFAVDELGDGDLAGECAIGFVVDVLSSYLEAVSEVLADQEEVQSWRSNNDLCLQLGKVTVSHHWLLECRGEFWERGARGIRTNVGVKLSVIEVVDNLLDGRDGPVPEST